MAATSNNDEVTGGSEPLKQNGKFFEGESALSLHRYLQYVLLRSMQCRIHLHKTHAHKYDNFSKRWRAV